MDKLVEVLGRVFEQLMERLYEILVTVILETLVNFLSDVVDYFKQMALDFQNHVPFVMKTDESNEMLGNLIPEELRGKGVVEGVYNKSNDTIDSLRYVGGQGIGNDVNNILGDESVIVLE